MKIAICSSLDFVDDIRKIYEELEKLGHEVILPQTAEKIFRGETTYEQVMDEKANGKFHERGIRQDSLNYYYKIIKDCDAALVANFEKKNIKGYIGGAVFLEMGFTHVLGKKIFLLNKIPNVSYIDEIKMMQPIVINNNLSLIK